MTETRPSRQEPGIIPLRNVDDGLDVFRRNFSKHKTFNESFFLEESLQKLKRSGLHRVFDFGDADTNAGTVVCEHTSQFANCRFWIDEDSPEKRVFLTHTEEMAAEFARRGYTEYAKNSVSDASMVPEKAKRSSETIRIDILTRPPPETVVIPDSIPGVRDGMNLAETVVEQFEERIVNVQADEVYSPMRFWTKERRKKRKISTVFGNRLNCYYAIKKLLSGQDPKAITILQCHRRS